MDIENMSIEKIQDEEKLLLKVTGRLDTTTAPRLEETLKSGLAGVNHLIFDFSSLEYISSAGLRVLLSAHKAMKHQGTMVVQGSNEEVREVFTITGFADILTVED